MRSPDRKLSTQEVARKRKKLDKTLGQLEGLKEGTRKHHRKMFKAEKTLDQVRTGYSGIRPNKSAFNRNEVVKDSLGEKDAWAKWEKGYMDRTHKFKGTKFEKPITPEENKKEMEMERGEFMYDKAKGQIRLKKTDDAERPIERKSGKKLKAGKDANYNRRDKSSYFYDEDFAADAGPTPSRQELRKKRKETRDNTLSKKKSPINLNDPYAGQYEAGAGGGADYFSNAEDFQKLFGSIGDAFSKAYTPENRAKHQEKRAARRDKRAEKKFEFSSKLAKAGSENVNPDYKKFMDKTSKIKKRAVENRTKALLAKKKKDQE